MNIENTKICSKCSKELPLHHFCYRKDTNKYRTSCRRCNKKYTFNREDVKLENIELSNINNKRCSVCKEIKILDDFNKDINTWDKKAVQCKSCIKLRMTKNFYKLKISKICKRFNESKEKIEELSNKKCCSICGKYITNKNDANILNRMCFDHDHITGKLRDVICNNCNLGLGLFNDNIEIINNAIQYLIKHKPNISLTDEGIPIIETMK